MTRILLGAKAPSARRDRRVHAGGASITGAAPGHPSPGTVTRMLREDWVNHRGVLTRPGFFALAVHRVGRHGGRRGRGSNGAVLALRRLCARLVKVAFKIDIAETASIGRRVHLAPAGKIVVADGAMIGDRCVIASGVTIGWHANGAPAVPRPVRIGPGARIGSGSVIMDGVEVGCAALVGPNAVVSADVPAFSRVSAPTAKVLRPKGGRTGSQATG